MSEKKKKKQLKRTCKSCHMLSLSVYDIYL